MLFKVYLNMTAQTKRDQFVTTSTENIPDGVKTHLKRYNITGVMVCDAIVSDDSKSPLVFSRDRVNVNIKICQKILKKDDLIVRDI